MLAYGRALPRMPRERLPLTRMPRERLPLTGVPQRRLPLTKAVGAVLAAVSLVAATNPRPAQADPPRPAKTKVDVKSSKKSKRKGWMRGSADAASWVRYSRGGVFVPEPAKRSPAEIAVATAHEQLGKPYRWGSSGPSSFDCSGLTMFAWAAAGVSLPHGSRAQFGSFRRIPLGELEPGDLVYRPGHIGLYIGEGRMIHAPESGKHVEIAPLRRHIGAVRPK